MTKSVNKYTQIADTHNAPTLSVTKQPSAQIQPIDRLNPPAPLGGFDLSINLVLILCIIKAATKLVEVINK